MVKVHPCIVYYKTPKNEYNKRRFSCKHEATLWIFKRLSSQMFEFKKISGDTWEIYDLDTIKSWIQ